MTKHLSNNNKIVHDITALVASFNNAMLFLKKFIRLVKTGYVLRTFKSTNAILCVI